jgi:hypothetical protein
MKEVTFNRNVSKFNQITRRLIDRKQYTSLVIFINILNSYRQAYQHSHYKALFVVAQLFCAQPRSRLNNWTVALTHTERMPPLYTYKVS